jgi:transposase
VKNSTARKLREVPPGCLVAGVDPHKKRHAVVTMTQDYVVQTKFKFSNTKEGIEEALEKIKVTMGNTECCNLIFAIETASHYWRNLAYFLDHAGIPFRLINQFTLKRRREGKELNRRKNDYRDAEVASQLICTGEFTDTQLPKGAYAELRASYNAYRRLVKERTRVTNLIKGLLDGVFPEFTRVFKDPCCDTALDVLATCPVPAVITAMSEDNFICTIRFIRRGNLLKKKLRALYAQAKNSIGIQAGGQSVSIEISLLVEKLRLVKQHVFIMQETLTRLVDQTQEGKYLLSIIGLNYISVAGLLAEIGSFEAYHSAKQLVKMAGSNPTESESAGKRSSRTPMSKHGRPALRYCAWTAVVPMLRFNPDFRAWAKRLKERPLHANPLSGKEVVGAALNKLLRVAFALVKKRMLYQLPELEPVLA